jgi:hypothetical protein
MGAALGPAPAQWDADRAVTAMYDEHYRSLAHLAAPGPLRPSGGSWR